MDAPILSIYIATYNHENYIARALDSVLMQKTKYKFEVLIGEDCSTDNTAKIIKQYEDKYPGFFTVFYREKNTFANPELIGNATDLRNRCRGKYIIGLEGDDFWTDETKIDKQIDFLEKHQEYLAIAHKCVVVGKDSSPNGEVYPECYDSEYTLEHFVKGIMPGQLATVMVRNYAHGDYFDISLISKRLSPKDRLIWFSIICNGRIYCAPDIMSAYRHITSGGSSFSACYKYDFLHDEKWNFALIEYSRKIKNKKALIYSELLYTRNLLKGIVKKQLRIKESYKYLSNIEHKAKVVKMLIKQILGLPLSRSQKDE